MIIAGIAGIVLVWQEGFGALAISAERIILVLFVAALVVFGYNYFRQNQLAWLVLKPWQRCGDHHRRARHRVPADRRLPAAGATASRRSA